MNDPLNPWSLKTDKKMMNIFIIRSLGADHYILEEVNPRHRVHTLMSVAPCPTVNLSCRLGCAVRFVVVLKLQGSRFDPVYRTMLANYLGSLYEDKHKHCHVQVNLS